LVQIYTVGDIISDDDNKIPTFLEFATKEANDKNTSYKSKNLYYKVIELLKDFAGKDFYYDKLTLKFIRDFDRYLYSLNLHQNTVAIIFKNLFVKTD